MVGTVEQDAWVTDVLGLRFDLEPAGAAAETARSASPNDTRGPASTSSNQADPNQASPNQASPDQGGPGPAPPDQRDDDPNDTGFFDRVKDLVSDVKAAITGEDPRVDGKKALLARLATLTDPAGAAKDVLDPIQAERATALKALEKDAPSEPELEAATKSIAKLAKLIDTCNRKKSLTALGGKDPEAAKQAGAAFDKFDKVLGDTDVTPEASKKAAADRAAKEKELAAAVKALKDAKALPEGPKKVAALAKAEKAYGPAKAAADKAAELADAMLGQTSLTKAISHGPLSPESSAPFKPETTQKLIAAYGQDPRMADSAVAAAGSAKFPDAIADNVGPMISHAKDGFKSKGGTSFDDRDTAEKYGQDLLKMGGDIGPDYFSRLPDYVDSGQQFVKGATGDKNAGSWAEIAQNRSVKLAGNMLKPDGSIDTTSDDAKNAVGNVLFHPDAMRNPTPALNAHVVKTTKFMSDPTTGPQASAVMKGVTAPTNPAAQKLVQNAVGATGAPTDQEARTAVMASMMKPLDQGPVGSCFATAPARRMRETQPIDAMKAYADIASKGTYKPPFGPEVPAVTNLPPGQDPIMRSWEYTTATATARKAGSAQSTEFSDNVAKGTDQLKTVALKGVDAKDQAKTWKTKQQKLAKDVAAAFTFTYDPMSVITSASDGKSSQGRYVIEQAGKQITSKADFEAAMLSVALSSLGIDPASDEAKEVDKVVKSAKFSAAVCPDGYQPWALASGGQTPEATKTLFGDNLKQEQMAPEATDPKPTEADRTKQVLSAFLKNFQGSTAEMATIRTVGMHGFNALPNDPSLAGLKGATDKERGDNMQKNLVDKGKAIKDTALPPERAAYLFDQVVDASIAAEGDPDLKKLIQDGAAANRPKAAMKPAQVAAAVQKALDAYHQKQADDDTASWKSGEEAAGKTVKPTDVTKHKTDHKASLDKESQIDAKNGMMKDLAAPQFTIADTNWGGAGDHTFFVIAPDPTTGEPLLWEKTDPPGSLRPAGREWVDKQWAAIQ